MTIADTRADQGRRRAPWSSAAAMGAVILTLTVVGWGVLLVLVAPQELSLGTSGVLGVGVGVTAYTLGVRHAFDADHIAAIDNTTRKLMTNGQRPVSVGFWFSLGHSSIVFALCLLLSLGVRALVTPVTDGDSTLQNASGTLGTLVSGGFLILIGVMNLLVLRQIVALFWRMRAGEIDEGRLDDALARRGLLNRLLRPVMRGVSKPWHMYPVGLLFGLGFDTATEVSLLVLAGGAAAFQLPWYAILCLPVLFAAGMSLFDTVDGFLMNCAYGWASDQPVRKLYYNIAVTALSVAVALLIGSIEILGLLVDKMHVDTGPIAAVAHIDLTMVGYVLVGLFLITWVGAAVGYRLGGFERRQDT